MTITNKKYFPEYQKQFGSRLREYIQKFDFNEKQIDLDYLTQVSAVYSSNIEGNSIDLNSYMNYKLARDKSYRTKEIEEIETLVTAYQFAQKNGLNEEHFLECHRILSKTLLIESKRGKYRNEKVGVFGGAGLVYLALEPEFVAARMKEFFENIQVLLDRELNLEECFYFASLIHLTLAHVHPFSDGNGRAVRLLEKWFLAEKRGEKFWKIPSEKYYKENRTRYYEDINLGVNYYELNYDNCLPFLSMLIESLK